MPTASTAQILGNNESFEPFTSNMFTRRVLAGEFAVVNKYLLNDLIARGLWTPEIRNQIIADKGSVQSVAGIPDDLKALYKTTWEIKQKCVLDMSADRGAFICQSQSLNLHIAEPSPGQAHEHALLRLEEGPQDGHVLPPDETQGRRDRLHRRPGHGGQVARRERACKPVNTEPEECRRVRAVSFKAAPSPSTRRPPIRAARTFARLPHSGAPPRRWSRLSRISGGSNREHYAM